jgi:hypothetical protein
MFYNTIIDFISVECGYLLSDDINNDDNFNNNNNSISSSTQSFSSNQQSPTIPNNNNSTITNTPSLEDLQVLTQQQSGRILNISQHFQFLSNSVWPVIDNLIGKKLAKLFTCGVPDYFANNYLVSIKFLDEVEVYFDQNLVCSDIRILMNKYIFSFNIQFFFLMLNRKI